MYLLNIRILSHQPNARKCSNKLIPVKAVPQLMQKVIVQLFHILKSGSPNSCAQKSFRSFIV